MQIYKNVEQVVLLALLMFILILIPCTADSSVSGHEFLLLSEQNLTPDTYDELIDVADVFASLSRISEETQSSNISLKRFSAKPGAILSPDAILPVPEVLYILKGTALITADDTEVTGGMHDAIYIPPEKIRRVENAGEEQLEFFSIIDWNTMDSPLPGALLNNTTATEEFINTTMVQSEVTVHPVQLGDESSGEAFTVYRLLHPESSPFLISYDLLSAELNAGSHIADHYIDDRYQLITILSGSGNISVSCSDYQVHPGDILFVAPGALWNMTSMQDMHMLVLTHPFYREESDHQITGACETRRPDDE